MEQKLTLINHNGEKIEYDVIFSFDTKLTNKKIIIYTDYSKTEDGTLNLWAGYYLLNDPKQKFYEVTEESEKKLIQDIIAYMKEIDC